MDTLSTQELLDKLGLKSSRTLRHWRSLGLIGNPQIVPHPDGRGRIAKWPTYILAQCLALREKLQSGSSLEEIVATPKKRRYVFADDQKLRERNLALFYLRDGVLKSLRRLGREHVSTLRPELITPDHLAEAQEFVCNGESPVLVLLANRALVIAESQLGQVCVDHPQVEPFVVVPIGPYLDSKDQYPDE